MLQSRAGCWSRMFPCSCLVFKSRLAPGAARAPRAARLSPAPCLCPACGWGGQRGALPPLPQVPPPGPVLSGVGALLGPPEVLPWEGMRAGGASASPAYSRRKHLLLLSIVLQDKGSPTIPDHDCTRDRYVARRPCSEAAGDGLLSWVCDSSTPPLARDSCPNLHHALLAPSPYSPP